MTAKKNALGRGLSALIEDARVQPQAAINEIEIILIDTNPFQPRSHFDEESLMELAESIKQVGLIQPITVRQVAEGRYQLITGERRLRASKLAGFDRIPAYVRTANDQAMLEMALVENIQREDLDPIEVSISYQRLMDECNLTQEVLSSRVGKKRSTISNYLRLLKLPAEIQLGLRTRQLTMGHARTLVNIEDPKTQMIIYQKILDKQLSVRKIEEMVRNLKRSDEQTAANLPEEPKGHEQLEAQLSRVFNTTVRFQRNASGKGKIIISFHSDEMLEQILEKLDHIQK